MDVVSMCGFWVHLERQHNEKHWVECLIIWEQKITDPFLG